MDRTAVRILSGVTVVVATTVIVGWFFDVASLKSVVPGLATMKFNTAFAFLMGGTATFLSVSFPSRRWSWYMVSVLGAMVALLAGATMVEWGSGSSLGIDELLFADPESLPDPPGRMSVATAMCFLFLGSALAVLDLEVARGFRPAQFLALVGGLLGLIGVEGYVFDVSALYELALYSSMALHTAILMVLLGTAILLARPDVGFMAILTGKDPGGHLARRLMPIAVVLPFAIVWLRLQGQQAGLFGNEIGSAISVAFTIVIVTGIVWFAARSVNRLHYQQVALDGRVRAAQRMETVGRMASGVAHDFNNLLTVMRTNAELAREHMHDRPEAVESLNDIELATATAGRMVGRLLSFSRSQASDPQLVDINPCIEAIEPILRRLAGPSVQFHTKLHVGLGHVRLDPSGLDQVLTNLVANARDAMPTGGSLTIETANVELDETTAVRRPGTAGGPHVMLSVSDSGTGMDASVAASIFEPFYTTKPKGKGTGLGLTTVQKIVEDNGGSIWVYSEVGSGTTFKLHFPRVGAAPAAQGARLVAERPPSGTEMILLVEDDASIRAAMRGWLERLGYTVVEASGGAEAVELVTKLGSVPDLLITDVVMPGMSGAAVSQAIRARAPDIAIVVVSGHSKESLVEQGLLDSSANFVEKPFSLGPFSIEVRRALDARVSERAGPLRP